MMEVAGPSKRGLAAQRRTKIRSGRDGKSRYLNGRGDGDLSREFSSIHTTTLSVDCGADVLYRVWRILDS